jgi:hypothetical protein
MSNPKYHCPIPGCKGKTAHQHFINHLLKHSSEELQKHLSWSAKTLPSLIPKINNLRSSDKCSICFGCKKIIKRVALQVTHKDECQFQDNHLAICKSIFDGTKDKKEEDPEEPENEERSALRFLIDEFAECKTLLEINFPALVSALRAARA